jgi:hypothetical protein
LAPGPATTSRCREVRRCLLLNLHREAEAELLFAGLTYLTPRRVDAGRRLLGCGLREELREVRESSRVATQLILSYVTQPPPLDRLLHKTATPYRRTPI